MERILFNVKSALSKMPSLTPTNEDTDSVEINKSIMELNFKRDNLQREVDGIQKQILFLVNLRDSQRPTEDDEERIYKLSGQSLFDDMFGG